MKKRIVMVMLLIGLLSAWCMPVSADCAPKPVTVIYTTGEDSETVFLTLLGEEWDFVSTVQEGRDENPYSDGPKARAWNTFISWKDSDGLSFSGEVYQSTVHWGYYAPDPFKVALYFPETDVLLVSEEVFERYAFQSNYSLNLDGLDKSQSGVVSMPLDGSVNWMAEIFRLIPRILITLGIEILLALLWGYKNQIRLIVTLNLITQIGLNIMLSLWYLFDGPFNAMLMLLQGELVVLIVESIFYIRRLPGKGWAFFYTVTANLLSCWLGFQILEFLGQ